MIRISGVTIVEVEGSWHVGGPSAGAVSSIVLLRSPADVQVIKPPSWWTTLHVICIAVAVGVLLLALIIYARMERRRLQAVFDERERLANEMHDTLAQSFAGIGFQLQAIRRAIPTDIPELRQQVDLARNLVRHSHKEARRTIEPLGADSAAVLDDLMGSLVASASKMVEGGAVEIAALKTGLEIPLPAQISAALLRIGQEAIANAIRHADPSRLEISISYERNSVRLSVTDNGCGFVMSGDLLGFGLRGMHRRSAAISAELEISSYPGEGTRVELIVPLPHSLAPGIVFKRVWKYISEGMSNVDTKIT